MFSVRPHPGWDLRPLVEFGAGQKLDSLSGLPGLDKIYVYQYCGFYTAPLQFVTVVGGGMLDALIFTIIYSLVQFFCRQSGRGYTTTHIVLLLIGSAIMLSLGIIGYYIAKIYEEADSVVISFPDSSWKRMSIRR